jgi:hypothetical protein
VCCFFGSSTVGKQVIFGVTQNFSVADVKIMKYLNRYVSTEVWFCRINTGFLSNYFTCEKKSGQLRIEPGPKGLSVFAK